MRAATYTNAEEAWTKPPAAVRLEASCVDVWRIDIPEYEGCLPALRPWLNEDELARAKRFVHERKRCQFVVARAALRAILGGYLRCAPRDVCFDYTEHGKPFLGESHAGAELTFNLSHSRDLALCAVTLGHDIGVDTEHIRPDRADESIARRFFAPGEVAALLDMVESERAHAFYHCWTSKEAYVKAVGEGLSHPLDRFCVSVEPGRASLLTVDGDEDEASRWSFRALPVPREYAAACAVKGTPTAWRLFRWSGIY